MKDLPKLVDAVCATYTNPDLIPKDGKTYCNIAADSIARVMGCLELSGKTANDIVDYMSASQNWVKIAPDDAQFRANVGTLVYAVLKEDPHGHICVVMPGYAKFSGRFGKCATVMNIGKNNFISKGWNWAFQECPTFYAWRPSL